MSFELVKSENFYDSEANFYRSKKSDSYYMTGEQLSRCLGYKTPNAVNQIVSRNPKLKDEKYSTCDILSLVEGGRNINREVRLFNERGIYKVAFKATTDRAEEFQDWVADLLVELHSGELQVVDSQSLEPVLCIQTQLNNLVDIVADNYKIFAEKTKELIKQQNQIKYMVGQMLPHSKFSDWKKDIGRKIRDVAEKYNVSDEKKIYNKTYIEMDANYGAQINSHKQDYLSKINRENCPTIDVIDYYGNLRDLFESLVMNYAGTFERNEEIS